MPPELCWPLDLEWLIEFEDLIQSIVYTYLYGVRYTWPSTIQIFMSNLKNNYRTLLGLLIAILISLCLPGLTNHFCQHGQPWQIWGK